MAIKTVEFVEIEFTPTFRSRPLVVWCEENIGTIGRDWDLNFTQLYHAIFEFTCKEDAILFTLRWSGQHG